MIQIRPALPYWSSIFCKKATKRGALRGVAHQHLVSQRKAFRSDHQSDDHLYRSERLSRE